MSSQRNVPPARTCSSYLRNRSFSVVLAAAARRRAVSISASSAENVMFFIAAEVYTSLVYTTRVPELVPVSHRRLTTRHARRRQCDGGPAGRRHCAALSCHRAGYRIAVLPVPGARSMLGGMGRVLVSVLGLVILASCSPPPTPEAVAMPPVAVTPIVASPSALSSSPSPYMQPLIWHAAYTTWSMETTRRSSAANQTWQMPTGVRSAGAKTMQQRPHTHRLVVARAIGRKANTHPPPAARTALPPENTTGWPGACLRSGRPRRHHGCQGRCAVLELCERIPVSPEGW